MERAQSPGGILAGFRRRGGLQDLNQRLNCRTSDVYQRHRNLFSQRGPVLPGGAPVGSGIDFSGIAEQIHQRLNG